MTIFTTLPNFIKDLVILGVPVVLIVEVLKRIPNKYWALPNQDGSYGTITATIVSIIAVCMFANYQGFLNMEGMNSVIALIIGVVPFSLGLFNLIKRIYITIRGRFPKKV